MWALAKTWSWLALCGVLGDYPELLDDIVLSLPGNAEDRVSLPVGSDDMSLPANTVVPAARDDTSSPEPGSARVSEECDKAVPGSAEECNSAANAEEAPPDNLALAEVAAQVPGEVSPIEGGKERTPAAGTVSPLRKGGDGRRMPSVPSPSAEVLVGAKEVQSGGEPGVGNSSVDSRKGEDEQPKAIVTPAGEGEPVSSPAEVDTDLSGQESAEDGTRGSSADGVPGSTPMLDHGDRRHPLAKEVPGDVLSSDRTSMKELSANEVLGDVSSSDQTGMKEPLADEVPGDVSSSDQTGMKEPQADEVPSDVSSADRTSMEEALASDVLDGGASSDQAGLEEPKVEEPADSVGSAEGKSDVPDKGGSGEEDSERPTRLAADKADSGSVVVSVGVSTLPSDDAQDSD